MRKNIKEALNLGLLKYLSGSPEQLHSTVYDYSRVLEFIRCKIRLSFRNYQKNSDFLEAAQRYLKLWKKIKPKISLLQGADFPEDEVCEKLLKSEKIRLKAIDSPLSPADALLYAKLFVHGGGEMPKKLSDFFKEVEKINSNVDPKTQYFAYKHQLIYQKPEEKYKRYKLLVELTKNEKKANQKIRHKAEFCVARILLPAKVVERESSPPDYTFSGAQSLSEGSGAGFAWSKHENIICSDINNPPIVANGIHIEGDVTLEPDSKLIFKAGFLRIDGEVRLGLDSQLILDTGLLNINKIISEDPDQLIIINGEDRRAPSLPVKDSFQSWDWYEKAAGLKPYHTISETKTGNARAQYKLGKMYLLGKAGGQAPIRAEVGYTYDAFRWIKKSAIQGYGQAQNILGLMYYLSYGIPKKYLQLANEKALFWWGHAALKGNKSAQVSIGWMYEKGYGVTSCQTEADHYYEQATSKGDISNRVKFKVGKQELRRHDQFNSKEDKTIPFWEANLKGFTYPVGNSKFFSDGLIKELDLTFYSVGDKGAKRLATALRRGLNLQRLILAENDIEDKGAKKIAEALEHNTALQYLSLTGNAISAVGLEAYAKALRHNLTLQHLRLDSIGFGLAGAHWLAVMLRQNASLHYLDLESNGIKDEGARKIAEALKRNTTLQYLNLRTNQIRNAGAKAIIAMLKKNNSLQKLNISNNLIEAKEIEKLSQIFGNKRSLDNLNTKDQNSWSIETISSLVPGIKVISLSREEN